MDVPTLMHNLKEEVTCSVCIHLYKEPKQLPCLHIFCLECLNDLVRTSTHHGKIKCPLCQIEVAVPESGTMDSLPDCFYLKNLLDILAIKECNTSKVTCGNCDTKSEEASYCFHCCKFWCKECLNGHNILRENKEHRVLALKDFQDKDFEDVLKPPAFCPKELHEKGVYKFYCKVCKVPACPSCVTLEHSKHDHDVVHLEIIARELKKSIASKLDIAKTSCQPLSSCIRELKEHSLMIEHRSQHVKRQVQQTVKSIILSLQQQEQELITEVENRSKETQDKLRKQRGEFQDRLNKKEETISQIERLVERSTAPELVRSKAFVNALFVELQELEMPILPRKIPIVVFLKNQKVLEILSARIGHIYETVTVANQCSVEGFPVVASAGLETYFGVTTRDSEGEQCYCPGDNIAVEIMSGRGEKIAAYQEMTILDKNNGSYAISFIPAKAEQYVVSVQINGEKMAKFLPVRIKERSFKPVESIGVKIDDKSLANPWGVAGNHLNEIFVSDMMNNRLVVLNEKGKFIRSFGQNQVNEPTGITIDKDGRSLVVSRGNNNIIRFNPSGEYVSTVNKAGSLKEPRGISLDSRGNIIVCDTENKCVKIFSPQGKNLKIIGVGRLDKPFECLCYEDKIFVSDREAHVIKVFRNNGRFLYEFGKHGNGDGELNLPTGLAVDKTGHLLVCSVGNHRVQVFTLDGKFVTKFGEHGKGLGQFEAPCSVSVLKSGHIVVCEFRNNRLQLFA